MSFQTVYLLYDPFDLRAAQYVPPIVVRHAVTASEARELWRRYREHRYVDEELGLSLDISRVRFEEDLFDRMQSSMANALRAMHVLEAGAISNPDEGRRVGHYWLRNPRLAPAGPICGEIERSIDSVRSFVRRVHAGEVCGTGGKFEHMIHIGIGGSAVGPQLICNALSPANPPIQVHFLDNSDPEGIDDLLERLHGKLDRTLVSVVSKSGWTPTPHMVMLELEAAYARAGLSFAHHAVATTVAGTELDKCALEQGWLTRFPLWDWVGGRTSITSAVGLLPAALSGADISAFLGGAAAMDDRTRRDEVGKNPAALLALMWYSLGSGRGDKAMVVLPYRDRLSLLARYVQQLVMESIGKKQDRSGAVVHQGLTVYGYKGSTDQHSYVQQLRDGQNDFFVLFISMLDGPRRHSIEVAPGLTLADHLFGNLEASRDALFERGRESITIGLEKNHALSLGALIALLERAIGLYAELLNINAYHQPGVEKDTATKITQLQLEALAYLKAHPEAHSAEEIADGIGKPDRMETIHKILERLSRLPAPVVKVAACGMRFSSIPSQKGPLLTR